MKVKVVMPIITPPEIRPEDRRYIERFDFQKAKKESLKRLNKRPFYTK